MLRDLYSMPKQALRGQHLAERRSRPSEDCVAASETIQQRFLLLESFHRAECLALYSPVHNEVLTDTVAKRALELGKVLAYPRVRGDELEFVQITSVAELKAGAFGVLEPQGTSLVPAATLDLVVVPGLAFDLAGHRLGYGRGYYDRALAACRAACVKVGFAYDSQLLAALPSAEHDQRLSALLTESRTINI